MKLAIPPTQWLVFTPHAVNGTHWHRFTSRKAQRQFADARDGYRYDLRRSKH